MTIIDFKNKYKIKNINTIYKWIENGYIPNSSKENDYVPDSARLPYTQARAKNANAIYESIVKASYQRKHVVPELYSISKDEFIGYVDELVKAGFIYKRVSDNVTYYDATPEVKCINRKKVLDALEAISKGVMKGAAEVIISQIGA